MMNRPTELRNFRGGAWDLRRIERRKEQLAISFPDRRQAERRFAGRRGDSTPAGTLLWIENSDQDE